MKHVARPINELSTFNAQVDLVIPFHGQYESVTKLIESIFLLTRSNYYKIYVVDDFSPNPHFIRSIQKNSQKNAERRRIPNIVTTIRNDHQQGFGGSCRVGFEAGESHYVCFINSDCLIEDSGWLKYMGETLMNLRPKGVQVVSPMSDNIVGGDSAQQGEKFSRSKEDAIIGDDSFLSLYCFMCHRELFSNIDGFIKQYPFGGYEDEEFAYRLRHYGFKQAVSKSAWVKHEGEATLRTVMRNNPVAVETIHKNRERCIEDIKKLSQ